MTGDTDRRSTTLRCGSCGTLNRVDVTRAGERPTCGECGEPFRLDRPFELRPEDFDVTVGRSGAPILVDFFAEWCGPCKMLAPLLDDIAGENAGRVLVAKIDTDEAPELSRKMNIRGVPTVILFRNGEEVDRSAGIEPDRLRRMVADAA